MGLVRCVISVVLFALFVWLALANSVGVVLVARRKLVEGDPGGVSLAPILGGLAGALACVIAPVMGLWRWAWLPPLLDLGCAPMLIGLAIHAIRDGARSE